MKHLVSSIFLITILLRGCPSVRAEARADPNVELSGVTGFGAVVVGVTPGRLAISPSASLSVRGGRWFFAARAAHHPAYRLALCLHEAMMSMDAKDPAAIARLVADGALQPLLDETRFEIAVLIRLGRSLEQALKDRGFAMSRALIDKRRQHVFAFTSGGSCVRIHYNQAIFKDLGPRDRGIRHYFGGSGRSRPDMTIEVLQDEKRRRAVVVEVKFSEKDDERYLKTGYHEALVYRAEYDKDLTGWPKAILVVSSLTAIKGTPRREHEVIAVSWKDWVPPNVLEGLLEGLGGS